MPLRSFVAVAVLAALAGCSSAPKKSEGPVATRPASGEAPKSVQAPRTGPRGGGYYLDDGPGDNPPPNLDAVPDAVPRNEPLHRGAMRPYSVMGRNYTPMTTAEAYKARGVASWYGRRYHGKPTSSGEPYDMYGMTAAHPILPIPSYVRVTNVATNRSVVVRVNDRGPFIDNRLIDLSYTAAYKLGLLAGGSGLVEVERLFPDAGSPPVVAQRPAPPKPVLTPPAVAAAPAEDPIAALLEQRNSVPANPAAGTVPPPPAAATVLTAMQEKAATGNGVYLQLAAFGVKENAESYLVRLQTQIEGVAQVSVVNRDGMFRVHAGPYADAAQARDAAERIGQMLGIRPMVLLR